MPARAARSGLPDRSRSASERTDFGTNSSATSPRIATILISGARRSQPLPPRWRVSFTPSSKAVPITGPSSKGGYQGEEPLSARAVRAQPRPCRQCLGLPPGSEARVEDGEGHEHPDGPFVCYGRDLFLISWKPPGSVATALELTTITPRAHVRGQRRFACQADLLPLLD